MRQAILLVAAGALASAAAAEEVRLCGGQLGRTSDDGRLFNHLPYAATARAELVRPPQDSRHCRAIHRDMQADLEALLADARADPGVGKALIVLSCFRSPAHQQRIFCRQGRSTNLRRQAYQVAPPGFSEHATGLAVDFGESRGRCNLEACFARTAAGRWLLRNAPSFGFELSFPEGNAQGIAFEPWHWRWVGRDVADGRARSAPTVFAAARQRFPTTVGGAAYASAVPVRGSRMETAQATPASASASALSMSEAVTWPPAGFRGNARGLAEP